MEYKITNKAIDKLKYDLVREGILDYNQLIDAIDQARELQTNLGQILVQNNIITEENLLNFLEKKLHIPYVDLDSYTIDLSIIDLISKEEALKYKIVPLFIIEDTLTVAMSDPLDLFALNNINIKANYKVEPVICAERSILNTIDILYSTQSRQISKDMDTSILANSELQYKFDWQSELNEDNIDEVNIYRLVRAIVYQAVEERATEIHFDPQTDMLQVRFRIDNFLHNRGSLPILLASSCISRIKSAAGMNSAEQFLPQHGLMELHLEKNIINARISTFPTNLGEKIVIKIFNKVYSLDTLGLEADQLSLFTDALTKDSGLIIAASPLGNGQITTFYAILQYLNKDSKNIMTIESSIRYNLEKINQSQININKGFSLKQALDSIQYQEPDVIYINELPNVDHIELLVRLALSGKLVFTSMLAENAIDLAYKLHNKNLSPNVVNKALLLTFNQKLIRLLCPDCKVEDKIDIDSINKLRLMPDVKYFKAKGCHRCNNTGYKGLTAVFEIFSMTEYNKIQATEEASLPEQGLLADSISYKSLLKASTAKLNSGITSLSEVLRINKL